VARINDPHQYLPALKAIWNYPEELLNRILWQLEINRISAWSDNHEKSMILGLANSLIDYMDGQEIKDPKDAWKDWASQNEIYIEENPFE